MSFTNFGSSGNSGAKALMQQIQQESAMANARQLVSSINNNCFDKCVTKPGASLSSGEETCMGACMEKYMAAWNTAAKTYTQRLSQQRQSAELGM